MFRLDIIYQGTASPKEEEFSSLQEAVGKGTGCLIEDIQKQIERISIYHDHSFLFDLFKGRKDG